MQPIVRNGLALLLGLIIGGLVNMGIIMLGPSIVPLPEGVDPNDIESIKANLHLYTIGNWITPIVAHALGSLVGAYITTKLAISKEMALSIAVGVIFLLGGIMMIIMLPDAPMWMKATDLLIAYIPMGWLGWNLAKKK